MRECTNRTLIKIGEHCKLYINKIENLPFGIRYLPCIEWVGGIRTGSFHTKTNDAKIEGKRLFKQVERTQKEKWLKLKQILSKKG